MDYKVIFKALSDFGKLRREGEMVEKSFIDDYNENGAGHEVYKVGNDYVRLWLYTDSYGNNFEITGVDIVVPQRTVVTDFEPIKI